MNAKICFLSNAHTANGHLCRESACMAWKEPVYYCGKAYDCPDVDQTPCSLASCPNAVKKIHEHGYCMAINRD